MMSVYQKSWLFMAWVWLVFFSFPLWMTALGHILGKAGFLIGGAFWLSQGALALLSFRCPNCGTSLFTRGIWSVPWPAKRCSKCGRDNREAA
jgi:hypothetical protein